jgi:ribosomal protein L12E/L44/L45/RPP1/RPP2
MTAAPPVQAGVEEAAPLKQMSKEEAKKKEAEEKRKEEYRKRQADLGKL